MKKYLLFICTLFFVHFAIAGPESIKPYQKGDWGALINSSSKPLAVHFWGVTCAPCAREMPEWGKFLTKNKDSNVVFIQVDEATSEMASKMLAKANLLGANNYSLTSPFDEYLRHEIDPKWRGETPITILIGKNGKVIRKTGPMDFQQLQNWFKSQS
jgi:thiol-disulfide isomerase/thioredoxin